MKPRSRKRRPDPLAANSSPALEGALEVVSLATMLAVFELERRSGIIRLTAWGPSLDGARVLLRDGRPVQARVGQQRGRDALLSILERRQGKFDFTPGLIDVEDEVATPISWLLLEAARREDERLATVDQAAAF